MIRNSTVFLAGFLVPVAVLASSTLGASTAQAQAQPDSTRPHRNLIRVDVGGVVAHNFVYNALNNQARLMLPLLLGYERLLGERVSGNVEVLLNSGEPPEKKSGLTLQGRFYYYQGKQKGLAGLYVAPTLSYRTLLSSRYYEPVQVRRHLGGAGAVLGAQVPLGARKRFMLDVNGGIMAWTRLGQDQVSGSSSNYSTQTYYERAGVVFDGRISLGYRF